MSVVEEIKGTLDEMKGDWADYQKRIDDRYSEKDGIIEKIDGRLDALEVKLNRLNTQTAEEEATEKTSLESKAFALWAKYGDQKMRKYASDEEAACWADYEKKSLAVQDDNTLGISVPEDFRAEVIKRLPNISNVLSLVRKTETARDVIRYPRLTHTTADTTGLLLGTTDIATAGLGVTWEDEFDTATETTFALGQVQINTHKVRSTIRVGREFLEDTAIAALPFITNLFAERLAIEYDRIITKGAGGKTPKGFLSNASVPTVNSGSGGLYLPMYDSLVDLIYAMPAQYVSGASLMCKRTTLGVLRKIKDAVGQPLWSPPITGTEPSTLLGYPIHTNEHMPATGVANALSIAFANWNMLYLWVTKVAMSIQRLDELYAQTDEIGFIVRMRCGGDVVGEWAARYYKMT